MARSGDAARKPADRLVQHFQFLDWPTRACCFNARFRIGPPAMLLSNSVFTVHLSAAPMSCLNNYPFLYSRRDRVTIGRKLEPTPTRTQMSLAPAAESPRGWPTKRDQLPRSWRKTTMDDIPCPHPCVDICLQSQRLFPAFQGHFRPLALLNHRVFRNIGAKDNCRMKDKRH